MSYKGKRPRGFTAWQVIAMTLVLLFVIVSMTTYAGSEYTGKTAGRFLADTITQGPGAEQIHVTPIEDAPVQEDFENAKIEAALQAKANCIENCTVTHYAVCMECCGKTDGITASGVMAAPGVSVAVDPALIPLGSDVLVDYGDGDIQYYRADDIGGAVQGAHVDLCVGSYDEAVQLGVKVATVYWVPPAEIDYD